MGCYLLKHANNHFDTRETPHHDTIFNHRIDRLPFRYISQIPSLCLCRVCARMCLCASARTRACVCVDTSVYIYICTSELKSPKIYHMSGTFNKHSSLAIFDEHLVRQTNQGLPKILPQYPLETNSIDSDLNLAIE